VKIPFPKLFNKLNNSFNDPLFNNSFYLVLSRVLNMGAGFLFWVIAAKLYSVEDVGNATALISSLNLIILLAPLGFDISLIRFIFGSDRDEIFTTVLNITVLSTCAICLIYAVIDSMLTSRLIPNLLYSFVFLSVAVFNSVTVITGNMFLAMRRARHYLMQNVVLCLRLLLLPALLFLKSFGIFLSLGLCYGLASLQAGIYLRTNGVRFCGLAVSKTFVKRSLQFSVGNYFSNNLNQAPGYILPILVLHLLDAEAAAKFYLAATLGNLTMTIPFALSTSLLVEGSNQEPLKKNFKKALLATYISLIPCTIIVVLLGKDILGFFNPEYIEAYNLLVLVALSRLIEALLVIYISVQNIRMKVKKVLQINLYYFVLMLSLSYFLIQKFNIIGVGYAWLISYSILLGIMLAEFWEMRSPEVKQQAKIP